MGGKRIILFLNILGPALINSPLALTTPKETTNDNDNNSFTPRKFQPCFQMRYFQLISYS